MRPADELAARELAYRDLMASMAHDRWVRQRERRKRFLKLIRAPWTFRFSLTQKQADAITAISNVIFAVALLPTVMANMPPTPLTSAATIVALGMLQAVMLHFRLWWGCLWNAVCASMWIILLIQGLT